MASISFDFPPLSLKISSHAYYQLTTSGVPYNEILEMRSTEALNPYWESEGKEPLLLGNSDDDMADLEDPRLRKCAEAYMTANRERLLAADQKARADWEESKKHPIEVDGVMVRPGQAVRVLIARDAIRAHATLEVETAFYGIDFGREPYWVQTLYTEAGGFTFYDARVPYRRWIEPIEE